MQAAIIATNCLLAQGIHFSQYYNTPMLISPANAGLMSDKDYRIGASYRTQWGAVPVPFNSFALAADLQVFPNRNHTNWLGLGIAALSDKSGDGNLSMGRYEGFVAYHIQLGEKQMLSIGASVASVQRSIDFSKLSFDAQWDGSDFNTTRSNNEKGLVAKASYTDINAGINYAAFPSEALYIRFGLAMAHVNQPKESFLNESNLVGLRPIANIDVLVRVTSYATVNPSVYYTMQKGAWELMYGSLILVNPIITDESSGRLILGGYHRLNDAIVIAFGFEKNKIRIMGSYDYTISNLGQYINHNGALELGLRWTGLFRNEAAERRRAYQCPRF